MAVGFAGIALVSLGSASDGGTTIVDVSMVCRHRLLRPGGQPRRALQHRYGSVALMSKMLALATIWTAPFGLGADAAFAWAPRRRPACSVSSDRCPFVLMATLVGRVAAPGLVHHLPHPGRVAGLGALFRDDEVSALALLGVVLVLGGAVLASRREQ